MRALASQVGSGSRWSVYARSEESRLGATTLMSGLEKIASSGSMRPPGRHGDPVISDASLVQPPLCHRPELAPSEERSLTRTQRSPSPDSRRAGSESR
jgi:hypothetical protein